MHTILAVIKSGSIFVPLDSDHPKFRLNYIAKKSNFSALFFSKQTSSSSPDGDFISWDIDEIINEISYFDENNLELSNEIDSNIYVMYTSGSTGNPKGAILKHSGVRNRILWGIKEYGLVPGDRVLFKTSIAFDVFIWEVFAPLLSGSDIVIATKKGRKDVDYICNLINKHEVTHADFVPSMMSAFLLAIDQNDCPSLRVITCAGESLTVGLLDQIFRKLSVRVYNLYGPTEASLAVTYWSCISVPQDLEIPIGKPMTNVVLYLLNDKGVPVKEGEVGELYIGGDAPGSGYLNLPDKTAISFVEDRFSGEGVLYRTGDYARVRSDGNIMFLGRVDEQIKLRGARIELGEIENNLSRNELVQDAAVLAKTFGENDTRLVAYIALYDFKKDEHTIIQERIRLDIEKKLPLYMVAPE